MNRLYLDNTITDINTGGNEMAITSTMDGAMLPTENANLTNDQPDQSQFKVHVKRKTLFWMLIKYGFLTIITLGIYRFWAKTKIRRYLWSTVEFSGDRFEYHGTAKELFIGFLIALVVLVPLSIANNLISTAIQTNENISVQIIYSIAFVSVVLFLFEYAFYRMRRYQLTRTSWRSIRFGLEGSAANYALIATLWTYSLVFTLGMTYPFFVAWRNRKFLNQSSFGNSNFICGLKGADLLKSYALLYVMILILILAAAVPIFNIFLELGFNIEDEKTAKLFMQEYEKRAVSIQYIMLSFWFAFASFLIYNLYIFRKTFNRLELENTSITLKFSIPKLVFYGVLSVLAVLLTFFIVGFVSVILGTALTAGVSAVVQILEGGVDLKNLSLGGIGTIGAFFIPFLLTVIVSRAVSLVLFPVTLMRAIIPGLKIENPEKLKEIAQNSSDIPTHGEGFADALDVGAF